MLQTKSGLNVLSISNEPLAVVVAHGRIKTMDCDLSGGTFDCSPLTVDKGTFQSVAADSRTDFGG